MIKQKTDIMYFLPFLAFVVWTILVRTVDVDSEPPHIGFSNLNYMVHLLTGVHLTLYHITDYLEIVPIVIVAGFAGAGLWQLLKRKSLRRVDRDILSLGGLFAAMAAVYTVFELFPVNYRPVLINGELEASYPSSTTVLVICVMTASLIYACRHMENGVWKALLILAVTLFTAFMVIARLVSGVHWVSDIIGGILLSFGLLSLYVLDIRCSQRKAFPAP